MRSLILIFFVTINLTVFAQKDDNSSKWQSQVFVDLNASNKSSYEYYDVEDKARETSINGKGSLELAYNIDYRIIRKFSVSGIASLTNYNNPSFASIKTGLGLKLLYVDHKYHGSRLEDCYFSSEKRFKIVLEPLSFRVFFPCFQS